MIPSVTELFTGHTPVLAVITLDEVDSAPALAEALLEGGISILEITLRTAHGLKAITLLRKEFPNLCLGAGTVTQAAQLQQVKDAGAQFAVSPGLTKDLINEANQQNLPFLPGAVTPSEVLLAIEAGLSHLKFFPAEQSGGLDYLNSLAAPFPDIHFCPTGGINEFNYKDYLEASNVFCVGTTWLTPRSLVKEKQWQAIKQRAQMMTSK